MNQCAVYINKLDEYRKNVNRKIKTGQIDDNIGGELIPNRLNHALQINASLVDLVDKDNRKNIPNTSPQVDFNEADYEEYLKAKWNRGL